MRDDTTLVRTYGLTQLRDLTSTTSFGLLLDTLSRDSETRASLIRNMARGLWVQVALRAILAVFVVLVLLLLPPAHDLATCWVVAALYALVAAGSAWIASRGSTVVTFRLAWLGLFADVVALASLAILAAASDVQSWTSDILLNGFFILPLISAMQLSAWIGVIAGTPIVGVYAVASALARPSNGEPWSLVVLRIGVLAGLVVGCAVMSYVQRSRVAHVGRLAVERAGLLSQSVRIEQRERQDLAEVLHDGALQYLLAARQDLADANRTNDAVAFTRAADALTTSVGLLRSTVGDLHPVVLQYSGLPVALEEFLRATASRSSAQLQLHADTWPDDVLTSVDAPMYRSVRELVTNAVKHAEAHTIGVTLRIDGEHAEAEVSDDGIGFDPAVAEQRVAEGHIGLSSHRARIVSAGGEFTIGPRPPRGTLALIRLPFEVRDRDAL